jgi:S-layer protein
VLITTFDASGVVGNGADDTAANLGVTFVSANVTAAATVTMTGGAGNDALTGSVATDNFVLTSGGSDTVTLQATRTLNGQDTITGFTGGAVTATTAPDVLDIAGFAVVLQDGNAADATTLIFDSTTATTDLTIAGLNVQATIVVTGAATLDATLVVGAATARTGEIVIGDNLAAYILQANAATSTSFNLYRVFDSNGAAAGVTAEMELMGVVNMTNAVSTLVAGNIS